VTHGIVDTSWFLPQRRERVFFIGVRRDLLRPNESEYVAFHPQDLKRKYQIYDNDLSKDRFERILHNTKLRPSRLGDILENDEYVLAKSSHTFLTSHQWKKITAQSYTQIHSDGSGQLITENDACAQTLVSSYRQSYLMHAQFIVSTSKLDSQTLPRFFTPRECCRLQGFPEQFILPFHEREATNINQKQERQYISRFYRQIGNSVSPPCVIAVAEDAVNTFLVGQPLKYSVSCPVFDAVLKSSPCPEKVLNMIEEVVGNSVGES
jgi:DNA (cytosine-5)-methyltransferase 1